MKRILSKGSFSFGLRINIIMRSEAQFIFYGSAGISPFFSLFVCFQTTVLSTCGNQLLFPWRPMVHFLKKGGTERERKMEEGVWNNKGKWTDVKDKKVREKVRCKFKTRAVKDAGHLTCPKIQVLCQWSSKCNPACRLKLFIERKEL